jgi:hypothetical protein
VATATATAGVGYAAAHASARDAFVPPRPHHHCGFPLVQRAPLPGLFGRAAAPAAQLPAQLPAGPVVQAAPAAPAANQGGGGLLDTIGNVVGKVFPALGSVVDSVKEKGLLGAGLDLLGNVFGGRVSGAVENGKNAWESIKKGDVGGALSSGFKAIKSLFGF